MIGGYARASGVPTPLLVVGTDTLAVTKADVTFLALGFGYEHRVKDWVGVWLNVSGAGRVGTNLETLLAQGVQATSGYELGWKFRLYEANKSALALTTALASSDITGINILGWVDRIIEEGGLSDDNKLVSKGQSLRLPHRTPLGLGTARAIWRAGVGRARDSERTLVRAQETKSSTSSVCPGT